MTGHPLTNIFVCLEIILVSVRMRHFFDRVYKFFVNIFKTVEAANSLLCLRKNYAISALFPLSFLLQWHPQVLQSCETSIKFWSFLTTFTLVHLPFFHIEFHQTCPHIPVCVAWSLQNHSLRCPHVSSFLCPLKSSGGFFQCHLQFVIQKTSVASRFTTSSFSSVSGEISWISLFILLNICMYSKT